MHNGIQTIAPIKTSVPSRKLLLTYLIKEVAGSAPRVEDSTPAHSRWEWFDPSLVDEPDDLPEPWASFYAMHNRPDMRDCVTYGYRYVHAPEKILCQYPDHQPYCGVFCVVNAKATPETVLAEDLIYVGSEVA